jgi:hypothetical protein
VVISSSSESDGGSNPQQTGRANASKSAKNAVAAASKPPAKPKTQTTAPAPAPDPATGSMPLPPSRQLAQPQNDQDTPLPRPRSASARPAATPSNTRTPGHQTKAASLVPSTDRKTRLHSKKDTASPEPAPPQVKVTPCLDSKGKVIRNYEYLEGDLTTQMINESDPLKIEKANARKNREERAASMSAAVKRTASEADAESSSKRPLKKTKLEDLPEETPIDPTVRPEDEAPRSESLAANQRRGNNFPDNVPTDDDDDAGNSQASQTVQPADEPARLMSSIAEETGDFGPRKRARTFILDDLRERQGRIVTYGNLSQKLEMDAPGNDVAEEDFSWVVDELVNEGLVKSEGAGEEQKLWIVVDATATGGPATDDEDDEEDDEDGNKDEGGDDGIDRDCGHDNDTSVNGSEEDEDDNNNDNSGVKSQREINDKVRADGLERAVVYHLGPRGTESWKLSKLKERLKRNPEGRLVLEKDLNAVIEKLVEEGQVLLSGAGSNTMLQSGPNAPLVGDFAPNHRLGGGDDEDSSNEEGSDAGSEGSNSNGDEVAERDGVEAYTREDAHVMGKRQTHIQKHGNSRQPTTGYSNPHARVETSWRSPDAPASNTRGNLAQTPRATGTVDSRGDVLEHGLADGDELQDDADAEEQEAEQLKAKHGGKKGKHNAGVEKPLSQQRQSEASP